MSFSRAEKLKEQLQIIVKCEVLEPLSLLERKEFLSMCHLRRFKQGEYIFYQNDPASGLYIIKSGEIELTIDDPEIDKEHQTSLKLTVPKAFGSLALLDDAKRSYHAYASTDAELLGFFRPDFETLKERYPFMGLKIYKHLSKYAVQLLTTSINLLANKSSITTANFLFFTEISSQEKNQST